MLVRVNPSAFVSDSSQVGVAARRIFNATNTLASDLSSCSGMAGIDPMAEEFALGSEREGGYDQTMGSMLQSGVTLSQALAGFEGYLIALAASYRQIELAGADGGANEFISLSPTAIAGSCPYTGSSLGDEQSGTPQGDIMQWVEEFLRDNAGIIIPTANTGKVQRAASAWSSYETSLRSAQSNLDSALPSTLAATFPQSGDVSRVQAKLSTLIDDLAADANSLNLGCSQYATNVEEIRAELLSMVAQIVAEILIDIGIGLVLSAFTFGAGALVAAGKAITTVLRWVPRLLQVVNKLQTLIMQAKRTMAVVRRAAIEAIESTVSGSLAYTTVSVVSGDFSWNALGGTAMSSSIGGAISGPFSHIGSNITSRGGRVMTRAAVDGVTGGTGGIAGDWVASGATGTEFNLLMSALVGTTGGATAGGVTSIGGGGSARPNTGGDAGVPSQGGMPTPAPVASTASTASTVSAASTASNAATTNAATTNASASNGAPQAAATGGGSTAASPATPAPDSATSPGGSTTPPADSTTPHADAGAEMSAPPADTELPTDGARGAAGPVAATGAAAAGTARAGATSSSDIELTVDTDIELPASLPVDGPESSGGVPQAEADATSETGPVVADDLNHAEGTEATEGSQTTEAADAAEGSQATEDTESGASSDSTAQVVGGDGADPRTPESSGLVEREIIDPQRLNELADSDYFVAFFDRGQYNKYYTSANPTLGAPSGKFWVMPLEDGSSVRNASDAVRATGAAPGTLRAYSGFEVDPVTAEPDLSRPIAEEDRDLMAVMFRTDAANPPMKPTPADSGGYAHYLESSDPDAGHTALRTGSGPNAGYLVNLHIREYVINGGDKIGPGSAVVHIEDGKWIVERVF